MSGTIEPLVLPIDARQVTHATKSLDELASSGGQAESTVNKLASAARYAAAAFGLWKLSSIVQEVTLLAARYETLGVSMRIIGNNAGYTAAQMEAAAVGMQKMGISMAESRQQALRLVQSHIDLAQASKLARIAQDAAVIGNMNSSQAFATMIHGIQTGQTDVLRTIGLNISMEQSYVAYAKSLQRTSNSLTQTEKTQAILNAVVKEGAAIAGTYEAAMGTAAKQINSLDRYHENLKVIMGSTFTEALAAAVGAYTGKLKGLTEAAQELQIQGDLRLFARSSAVALAALGDAARDVANVIIIAAGSIGIFTAATIRLVTVPYSDTWKQLGADMQNLRDMQATAMEGLLGNPKKLQNATTAMFDNIDAKARESIDKQISLEKEYINKAQMVAAAYAGTKWQIPALQSLADSYGGDIAAEHGANKAADVDLAEVAKAAKAAREVWLTNYIYLFDKKTELDDEEHEARVRLMVVEMDLRFEASEKEAKLNELFIAQQKKNSEDLNRSLTDALMRGFEAGKGFAQVFVDTVQNMFNTMILRPVISAIISPLTAPIAAGAAGIGASLFGSAAVAATGAKETGGLLMSGGVGGSLTTLGTVAAGAAAAYVIAKYGFGWGNERENVGAQRMVGRVDVGGVNARLEQDWMKKGGWFASDESGTYLTEMSKAMTNTLKADAGAIQQVFVDYGKAIGDASIATKYYNADVNDMANGIGKQLVPALEEFRLEGETLVDTAKRLTSAIKQTNDFIKSLEVSALQQFQAAVSAKNALRDVATSIRDFAKTLTDGTLPEMKRVFMDVAKAAASGNISAQGRLQNTATDYLAAARAGSGSALDYARVVATVQNVLNDTATSLEGQVTTAELQLSELQIANKYLAAISLGIADGTLIYGVMKQALLDGNITATKQKDIERALAADVALGNISADTSVAIQDAIKAATLDGVVTANESVDLQALIKANTLASASNTSTTASNITALQAALVALLGGVNAAAAVAGLTAAVGPANMSGQYASTFAQGINAAGAATVSIQTSRYDTTTAAALGGITSVSTATNAALVAKDAAWKEVEVAQALYDKNVRYAYQEAAAMGEWGFYTPPDKTALDAAKAYYDSLPSFASGTNRVPYDMTANIHQDEMVVDAQSSNVLRKYGIGQGNNDALVTEIQALRREVSLLRNEAQASAINTSRTAKVLERFEGTGLPPERES